MSKMSHPLGPGLAQVSGSSHSANEKSIEQIYQKKTQLEHILLRPDSYIGSIQKMTQPMWILSGSSSASSKIIQKTITYVPGLYKIFDEILVNAADNKQRDPSGMNSLRVTIDAPTVTISVWNNGRSVPVTIHKEHKIYVPELIFGHLLTSSNYNDDEKKVTGGRNGYGAKLANIFSTEFSVEAADGIRGLRFRQTFRNNMSTSDDALVTPYSGPDYTCVTFKPDLARFQMDSLDADTVALLSKRVVDMAGVLGARGVGVSLNGSRLPISSFPDYVRLYVTSETGRTADGETRVWERVNDRWEVCVCLSDGTFNQVSFVNAIATTKGGQHVAHIVDQVTNSVAEFAKKKNKGVEVKPAHVKNYLTVFVNCLIENPAFDSQTKETLTTRQKDFGSEAILSDKFLKAVLATEVVDRVLALARFKATAELQKAGGGKKSASRLLDLPKLDDANLAGTTAHGHECTLIITEGDSAKSLAVAGLAVLGRDLFGVFPLKGKLLNVREASHKVIMGNAEIQNVVRIMGLQYGKTYESTKGLRYGHLMIMADQDHDGSHIKGLVLNFLHHFWPSLLNIPGFVREFITPIVKTSKGKESISFFTFPEYRSWRERVQASSAPSGWAIKYYKGLGTSTSAEAKEYFSQIGRHQLDFAMDVPGDTGFDANDLIDLAFSKKRADDRKEWLRKFEPGTFVNYDVDQMLVSDFIHKELILFSMADNVRSIPNAIDGLKPAQRKVLFSCFKRNLKADIKVAQLAGYVSEHSSYHHGEASLTSTIVGMAQTYVGSNNINLLVPSGQFGTRLMGGKDAASPRYIFTRLAPIARAIFHPDDDALLEYLDDDGQSIEPTFYVPIIPMALVNGAEGIGTGWSTSIPNYSPRKIISALRARIRGQALPTDAFVPWYRGFRGTINAKDASSTSTQYIVTGVASTNAKDTLTVTELPIGRWTQDYKQMLIAMITGEKLDKAEKKGATAGATVKTGKAGATAAKSSAAKTVVVKGKNTTGSISEAPKAPRAAATKSKAKVSLKDDDDSEEADNDDDDEFEDFEAEEDDDDDDDDDESDDSAQNTKQKAGGKRPKSSAVQEKEALAALLPAPGEPIIAEFAENHTDTRVHFSITTAPAAAKLMASCESPTGALVSAAVRKVFKLESSLSVANMHLFDRIGTIRRFAKPEEILDEFFVIRLEFYGKRKAHLLHEKLAECEKLANKVRFILAVLSGDLKIANKKKSDLLTELYESGYKGYDANESSEDADAGFGSEGKDDSSTSFARRYQYLLSLPLWSLTKERVQQLRDDHRVCEDEISILKAKSPESMWLEDLDALEKALDDIENADAEEDASSTAASKKKTGTGAVKKSSKGGSKKVKRSNAKKFDDDNDEEDEDDAFESNDSDYGPKKKAEKKTEGKTVTAFAPRPSTAQAPVSIRAAPVSKPSVAPSVAVSKTIIPPPVPLFKVDDDDDDIGVTSLAQRLAMRMAIGGGGGDDDPKPSVSVKQEVRMPSKKASRAVHTEILSPLKAFPDVKRKKSQPFKQKVEQKVVASTAILAAGGGGGGSRPSRAAATAASKNLKALVDDDDEEEEEEEDEEDW
jgi:DNA topoisomerase II